jgi:hypothetical protein
MFRNESLSACLAVKTKINIHVMPWISKDVCLPDNSWELDSGYAAYTCLSKMGGIVPPVI